MVQEIIQFGVYLDQTLSLTLNNFQLLWDIQMIRLIEETQNAFKMKTMLGSHTKKEEGEENAY